MLGGDNLGYKVKWVEDNLGVSRKALRNFEKIGLMPPNENRQYRDYSNEDIDRIWTIRLFQGIGYSLREIREIFNNENIDLDVSLKEKIKNLEEIKANTEKHLGYAKAIKLTGWLPSRPKDMGSLKFDDFYEKSLDEWNININTNSESQKLQELAEWYLDTPEDKDSDAEIEKLSSILQCFEDKLLNSNMLIMDNIIPKEIIKRKEKGSNDAEVQLLIKMLFDYRIDSFSEIKELTIDQLVRLETSIYLCGDIARVKEREFGKDGCSFIADAIAVFGGYNSYNEIKY